MELQFVGRLGVRHRTGGDEIDVAGGKDQLDAVRLLFVAIDHGRDRLVQPRRKKAQPLDIAEEEIDVLAEPVLEPEHEDSAAAEDHVRQSHVARLQLVEDRDGG